jgi:hypothetical protein
MLSASKSSPILLCLQLAISPNDLLHRRRRYEQKPGAMAAKELKQACRDRSLAVGGTKAVLLKRLKAPGNANGKNTAGKAKRKKSGMQAKDIESTADANPCS